MAKYFYVGGSESMWGGIALKTLGQSIDMTPEQAADAQGGGCVLLSADDFNAIGFTADELKKYPTAGYQLNAPQSFKEKQQAAWTKFGAIYTQLHTLPVPPAEPTQIVLGPSRPSVPASPAVFHEEAPSEPAHLS